jgi:hypothetical protein
MKISEKLLGRRIACPHLGKMNSYATHPYPDEQPPAARDENVERACAFIGQAAEAGPIWWRLPSSSINEYFPQYRDARYMEYAEAEDGYTQSRIREVARRHRLYVLSTIFEMARPGLYYDTAMLIGRDGAILGKYRKVHPAALLSLEKIYFRGGSSFPVFRIEEWSLGVSNCYDNLFPESCRCLALNGAELILAPYATPIGDPFHARSGKWSVLRGVQPRGARRRVGHVGQEHGHRPARKNYEAGQPGRRATPDRRDRPGRSHRGSKRIPAVPRSAAGRLHGYYQHDRVAAFVGL